MPYNDPDPADPTMLVCVQAPGGQDGHLEMAYVLAEEFVRMGFSGTRLMAVFGNPFYAGAHQALRALGEDRIRSIIRETVAAWGRFEPVVQDAPEQREWDVEPGSLSGAGKGPAGGEHRGES